MVYIREQPDPDSASLPHDRYDIVTKDALQKFPEDILRAVLERTDFQFIEFVEGEFTTVEVRRTDNLIKVKINDELVLVHIEFQVGDSTNPEMARRNVGYLGRCYERYGLPVLSHVIYLRPNAGQNDPGGYRQDITDYRFIVEYKVIRLIDLYGESVFETENIGLMPFAPLMQPPDGMEGLQWAIQCNERTRALSLPTDIRSNLLVSQWVMSGLIHSQQAIAGFLQEGIVQESSAYQHLLEIAKKEIDQQAIQQEIQQVRQQVERQTALDFLFRVLDSKFDAITVRLLQPALEKINDVNILKQLHDVALKAESLESFVVDLNISVNGS